MEKEQTQEKGNGGSPVEIERLVMPDYGDKVTFDHYYARYSKQAKRGKSDYFDTFKFWKEHLCDMNGIFLGTRTLKEGWRDYDSEEGYMFLPTRHFKVALISPGPNENPLYVPLTAIKA